MGARLYGGKSGKERQLERRERLLEAGLELFGTIGYPAAGIERLCAEAGLIPRYFYESFATREELLVAVYDRIIADTERRVFEALASSPREATARVARGLRAFIRSYLDDPRRGRIVCLEVVGVSSSLERHRRDDVWRFARIIVGEIQTLARAGLLPKRDARYTARALAGATNELVIEWLTMPDPLPVRRLEREILLVYLATFAGSAAASAAVTTLGADLGERAASRSHARGPT
jgi:AcrR family transcriptional regulator